MTLPTPVGLKIHTFGGLTIINDGQPITTLASRKAELLLVYLACQKRHYAREVLAELLWEGRTQSQAQANLRVVLSSLNKQLPTYVSIDRNTAGLLPHAPLWLDATEIEQTVEGRSENTSSTSPETIDHLQRALDLYRGEFLEGIYIPDARQLQAWIEQQRRYLHGLAIQGFTMLVDYYHQTFSYQTGIAAANRLVNLDPINEVGNRQLIHLLALNGQRSAALVAFERYKLILEQELGIQPDLETTRLAAQIQSGEGLSPSLLRPSETAIPMRLPEFLHDEKFSCAPPPLFVGRQAELQSLDSALQLALNGTGQLRFVTGDPGQGKSLLMEQFARLASAAHPELMVAMGGCSAFSGIGDSYLPFRDVLNMLTGRIESKLASGIIHRNQAYRLWQALPTTLEAILREGSHLIGTFIQGHELYPWASSMFDPSSPSLNKLAELAGRELPGSGELEPAMLFDEYLQVLRAISRQHPLLILVDDLQWADTASINLLFHLGRRIGFEHILLLAAYRAEEVELTGADQRTSFSRVLPEFKRQYGDIWIDLSLATERKGQAFVEALLDSEPNRLSDDFRRSLYDHTGGHPLFTVELCRSLQEKGLLIHDVDGFLQVQEEIQWHDLPARIEGVIETRLRRLDTAQLAILEAAAVEGEEFTLQVIAQVCELDERQLNRVVNAELCHTHHLIREAGTQNIASKRLYRFRFRHNLYREYLYQHLSNFDSQYLHAQVGKCLENLYGGNACDFAPQLGWHFSKAGETEPAIHYLILAGDQARLRYAYPDAIKHYLSAIQLLKEKQDYERTARTLMKLGLAYHCNLEFEPSRQAYDDGFTLWQQYNRMLPATPVEASPHPLRTNFFLMNSLDRINSNLGEGPLVYSQLFSGLVTYDHESNIIPDGATSWEILDEGCSYVFYLREDVFWSDGVPVTASDYVYAWKRILDPGQNTENAQFLYDVKGAASYNEGKSSEEDIGVKAIDDYTLVVELDHPAGYFLHLMAESTMFPVPAHILKVRGDDWIASGSLVTNGPFKVDHWAPGARLILSRNPRYHGQFSGNVEQVEISFTQDLASSLQLYEDDQLDFLELTLYSPDEKLKLKRRRPDEYLGIPVAAVTNLLFHPKVKPFDDLRVRQAFAHTIDREALVKHVFPLYKPAYGGLIPPGMAGHSPGIGLAYDPDKARELLAEAGYPGGEGFPEVIFLMGDIPLMWMLFDEITKHWRESLSIKIKPSITPSRSTFMWVKETFHICPISNSSDYPDCDWFIRYYIGSHFESGIGWHHENYSQMVNRARRELNQQKRLQLYMQADQLLMKEAIIVPTTYPIDSFLIKPWVKRFPILSSVLEFWKDVIIEPH